MTLPLITRDLVFHLEAAESAYHEAKLRALGAGDGNSRGIETTRVGRSVLFSIQTRRYNPSLNRVTCFSTEDLDRLDDILRWIRDRTDRFWFDVAPALVDDAALDALASAGLCPSFLLNVVYTVPKVVKDHAPAGVIAEQIRLSDQAHDFATAMVEGFGVPQEALESTERSVRIEYAAPEWRIYLAFIDGCPASMATLYVDGETASIDAMATVPRFRRRGCQAVLLSRCLTDAARAGCTLLASQTRPSSTSERNMLRAGFQVAYTKMLYSERRSC